MAIANNLAYIVVQQKTPGLFILNITNPASTSLVGSLVLSANSTVGYGITVDASRSLAFLSHAAGLLVVDVSNPSNPIAITNYATLNVGQWVVLGGCFAFIAEGPTAIEIVDVSIVTNMRRVNSFGSSNSSGYAVDFFLSGNILYLAYESAGLQIFNVSNQSPTYLGQYNPGTVSSSLSTCLLIHVKIESVYVVNTVAYLLDDTASGIIALDVSNPASPNVLGTVSLSSSNVHQIVVLGPYAYVASDLGLKIANVNNPASMFLLGSYFVEPIFALAINGPYVYTLGLNNFTSLSITSFTLSGTPFSSNTGTYQSSITANNNFNGIVSDSFSFYVNNPPLVENRIPNLVTPIAVSFNYTIPANTFHDNDNSSLIITTGKMRYTVSFVLSRYWLNK